MQSTRWSLLSALIAAAALALVPTLASAQSEGDIVRAEPDEINIPYDELEGYDEREVAADQTLTGLDAEVVANLSNPTLGGLVDTSDNISLIRISDASVDLGSGCDVFYGAEFDVVRTLHGSVLPMHERRIGRAEMLSSDECEFVRFESDVEPQFSAGEQYIFFASSDWGDVVLPVSMLDDVLLLTDDMD